MVINKNIFFFLLLVCINVELLAQTPFNDNCSFAQAVLIPDDGDTCFTGTNVQATSDGLYSSCDSATLIPLPVGGNEVWYTYIPTGTNNTITVTPAGGSPAQFVSVNVPNGNCSSAVSLACNSASTVGGSASLNLIFTPGTQVWFSVTALNSDGGFTVCVTSVTPPLTPAAGVGVDCSTAIPICDKHTFISPGPVFNNATGPISCYAFGPQNVLWYKFTAGTNDSLMWLATPNPGYELDWSLNDITLGCPGIPVACNFATTPGGGAPTGMLSGSVNPCGPISQICLPYLLTAGNTYALHFNIENFLNMGLDTPAIKIEFFGTFKMAPHAEFTINNTSGCDTVIASFINNSVSAVNYLWDFGNGNTSNLQNPPPQTYTTPGTYLVSLIASNPLSCASVYSGSIQVFDKPLAAFTVSDSLLCLGVNDSVTYTGTVNPNYTYNWNFSGATVVTGTIGSAGPFVLNWNSSGTKIIELTVTDTSTGCISQIFTRNVNVVTLPDSTFNMASQACVGETVIVNYNGIPNGSNTYNWDFDIGIVSSGSGAGPYSISFAVPGIYQVALEVLLNGCRSDDTNTITVSANPVSNAGLNKYLCSNEQTQLGVPASPGYNYLWTPGNALSDSTVADPFFSFSNNSTANDTLLYILTTSVGSCQVSDTVLLIVKPEISSLFSMSEDTLCGNEVAVLNYTGNAGASANYTWNFAGGNAVSTGGQNYTISWTAPAADSLSLFVTENGCSSDTTYFFIVAGDLPGSNAGDDLVLCPGIADTLGVTSIPGTTYSWSPSNGLSSSTAADPLISLGNSLSDNDTISYILTSSIGFCQSSDTVTVIVKPLQDVSVSGPVSACINNNSLQFLNTVSQLQGSVYYWNFGNNASPSTSALYTPPVVGFSSTGPQWIYLTVSGNGCPSDSDSLLITVFPVPVPGFSSSGNSGCPPLTVSFNDTTNAQAGSSYLWNFGNGDTSSLQNPVYTFQQPGLYDITLTITTPDTCEATTTITGAVQVADLPQPEFTATPPVTTILNPQVVFTSQSLNTDSCIYLFGDGQGSALCDVIHIYQDTGNYLVRLIGISSQGCRDTVSHIVEVNVFDALYVPNAFTPNDDGRNDVLTFIGSPVQDFHIAVFNRWGQLVFASDDINMGWNGKDIKSGKEASQGIYAYKLKYTDFNGEKHEKKGIVSLIR